MIDSTSYLDLFAHCGRMALHEPHVYISEEHYYLCAGVRERPRVTLPKDRCECGQPRCTVQHSGGPEHLAELQKIHDTMTQRGK